MRAAVCYAYGAGKGDGAMQEKRRFLRALLRALIAERPDAQGLYVPRGEAGIRRMIRALLAIRPARSGDDPLAADIAEFERMERAD